MTFNLNLIAVQTSHFTEERASVREIRKGQGKVMFLSVYKALLAIKEPVKVKESSSPQGVFKIAEVNRCTVSEQGGAS